MTRLSATVRRRPVTLSLAAALTLAAVLTLPAGPQAQAGERGGIFLRFHSGERAYEHTPPHGFGHRGDRRGPYGAFGFRDRHQGYDGYRAGRRPCRIVTKHASWHGRPARIAGTLCYDRYGRPFIVPGSRRVIGYYD